MVHPTAVGKVVRYFTPNLTHTNETSELHNVPSITRQDAIFYGTVIIIFSVINCTYQHNYMLVLTEMGIRIRAAFCSLIYRKSLKLSNTALAEISVGRIITLISKDTHSIDAAILFFNDIWIGVILILITTYLIFIKVGMAAFAGIGFLVAVIPLQCKND